MTQVGRSSRTGRSNRQRKMAGPGRPFLRTGGTFGHVASSDVGTLYKTALLGSSGNFSNGEGCRCYQKQRTRERRQGESKKRDGLVEGMRVVLLWEWPLISGFCLWSLGLAYR